MTITLHDQRYVLYQINPLSLWIKVWNGEEFANDPSEALKFRNQDVAFDVLNRSIKNDSKHKYSLQMFGSPDDSI